MAPSNPLRTASQERKTNETHIQVSLSLDGGKLSHFPTKGTIFEHEEDIPAQGTRHHATQVEGSQYIWIWTGIGFLDHMLHAWAKHAGWSLIIRCKGDLAIDDHHTTEDTLITLGSCFKDALGPRAGIARYGYAYAPLDEALSRAVVDISSRPFFVGEFGFKGPMMGALNTQMVHHGLGSWAFAAGVTCHVDVIRGENDHHRAESAFKALALACKIATARVVGSEGEVGSTKGVL